MPGQLNEYPVRPGLTICWGTIQTHPDLVASAAVDSATAILLFTLPESGDRAQEVMQLTSPRLLRTQAAGPLAAGLFAVALALDDSAWLELVGDDLTPGVARMRAFGGEANSDLVTVALSPTARLALESIRRCPFGGTCRSMALSARAHDLLIEFLTRLADDHPTHPVAATQLLEDQVRSAAQLLVQHLESPPSLAELAQRVGVSETTLKRGFHQVYRTTVFGYLRTQRMEKAHAALQSGTATVLEAAALVGYSNPSNFAAAFRRQFGVNPKTFQLAVRR
ncbi:AraC family transcriptional regulator [Opitutus sp. ER46]|uniref:helix-turn-helix transcriptional regulator n=1 Tax=Opitutus sp. ER46 TaxID=2161864 RepID=UPI0013050226|nr:AraC family transcriptional regulator [Opitutus sp. ER46]